MLTFTEYTDLTYAALYDGTNATDIRGYIETICGPGSTSMSGTNIVNPIAAVHVGDWLVQASGTFVIVDSTTFGVKYLQLTLPPNVQQSSCGIGAIPTLLAGANVNVDVTLKPGLTDTSYTAQAFTTNGLGILSSLNVNSITIIDADTVRVNVQNTGLVTLNGSKVVVFAVHN
jgi:hypothetical protein